MQKTRTNQAAWMENQSRWQIKVTNEDGIRKAFYCSTPGRKGKMECQRKADEWLSQGSREGLRLDEAWKRFMSFKRETCGTAWCNKLDSLYRTWIAPSLEYKKLDRITPAEWKKCILLASSAGKSRKTLENIRGALTAFFDWADENRVAIDKPTKIKIPKDAPVGERTILNNDAINILFSDDTFLLYGKPRKTFYIHAWRLIVLLGLRRGELAGIKFSDIDESNILHIRRSINSLGEITHGKTENARRDILLPNRALQVIEDQKNMLKQMGIATRTWLFPGPDGGQMDTNAMYKAWLTYAKQKGISCSLHELRHTMVSIVKTELPEDLLKLTIGHSDTMNTASYKHVADGDLERASNIIEGVFARIIN